MEALYTSKQVADILGINESSVKRWTNSGILKCFKTPGGHRKFKKTDVYEFAVRYNYKIPENFFTLTSSDTKTDFDVEKINEVLLKKILHNNEDEIFDYLNSLILSGFTVIDLIDKVISGVMKKIGSMWVNKELGIEGEHIATGRLTKSIIMLQLNTDNSRKNGLTAFCGCFEGELHELPLVCLSFFLKSKGWNVINAGINLPVESFVSGISKYNPDLVCVSSKLIKDRDKFFSDLEILRDAVNDNKSKLICGGSAVNFNDTELSKFDFYANSFSNFNTYLKENFPA